MATQQALGDEWTPDKEVDEEMPEGLRTMPGEQLIDELSAPRDEEILVSGEGEGRIAAIPTASVGGGTSSEGGSAFLGSLFSGIRSGARNALNLFTYFQMKDRAGVIGSTGVSPILRELIEVNEELRVHLVGHSFGGRLVTASVKGGQTDRTFPSHSMTLLQAAFSHNGFARDYKPGKDGYFRKVTDSPGLPGPILVTHTTSDLPNRWVYPMASRLAKHQAAAFGGPDDVYGAIGSNGAQHTPEAETSALHDTNGIYQFARGKVYNLESSEHITGHSNVTGPEVAHALISAVVSVGDGSPE